MKRPSFAALVLAAALAVGTPAAQAGRNCEARAPTIDRVERGLALAERTQKALDASGAEVVVIGRVGQDLTRYGQHYSHIGLAYKDGGRWRVVHKLNQCGTASSGVWRHGLGEFFLDDPWRYEAGFSVLSPEVARRLLPTLRDNGRLTVMHQPRYNMVAYPWATRYQQSNQWALETLAGSQAAGIDTRERAQAWLRLSGYQPAVLRIGAFTRLGGRVGSANIAFDDHPNEKRFADRIETVSADSVFAWLDRSGLGGPIYTIH